MTLRAKSARSRNRRDGRLRKHPLRLVKVYDNTYKNRVETLILRVFM